MDKPDPDRAKDRLESSEQRGDRCRNKPGTGGEEGKAEAEIDRAEAKEKTQVAAVMRTWAKRRVMTVAIENMKAMSSARPSPMGETAPSRDSDTMMATPA